jgi:hypothetical protein
MSRSAVIMLLAISAVLLLSGCNGPSEKVKVRDVEDEGQDLSLGSEQEAKPIPEPGQIHIVQNRSAQSQLQMQEENATSDLTISLIGVIPEMTTSGTRFYGEVYIANQGKAPSGAYDLALDIRDISRNLTYPIGTFREEPMFPGEQVPVWSSHNLVVKDPGSFQLWAEIRPLGFQDGSDMNNFKGWQFTVLP